MFDPGRCKFRAILMIAMGLLMGSVLPLGAVDFGEYKQSSEKSVKQKQIQVEPEKLWSGQGESLRFEVTSFQEDVLWVVADSKKIHLQTGLTGGLLPGAFSKRIPGEIYEVEISPFPSRPDFVLLSVFYKHGPNFRTTLYGIQPGENRFQLREIRTFDLKLVRPVDGRLYQQGIPPGELWKDAIYHVKTGGQFEVSSAPLPFTGEPRLTSLVQHNNGKWVYLDNNGSMHYVDGKTILDEVDSQYGTLNKIIKSGRSDRSRESLRLAPVLLGNGDLLAVAKNSSYRGGAQQMFTEQQAGFLELFQVNNQSLVSVETFGQQADRILDVETSHLNPNQLLWLAKTGPGEVALMMADFSHLNTSRAGN
ncbi:MAG: hypothetical protein ABEK50_06575 [bacterium]